jgi:acetone carboxylase gamma subunit
MKTLSQNDLVRIYKGLALLADNVKHADRILINVADKVAKTMPNDVTRQVLDKCFTETGNEITFIQDLKELISELTNDRAREIVIGPKGSK